MRLRERLVDSPGCPLHATARAVTNPVAAPCCAAHPTRVRTSRRIGAESRRPASVGVHCRRSPDTTLRGPDSRPASTGVTPGAWDPTRATLQRCRSPWRARRGDSQSTWAGGPSQRDDRAAVRSKPANRDFIQRGSTPKRAHGGCSLTSVSEQRRSAHVVRMSRVSPIVRPLGIQSRQVAARALPPADMESH
jgi:hypothetical protein